MKNSLNKGRSFQWMSMCAIPALLVFVFNYLPMAGIVIAFKNYRYDDGIFGSRWVGFKNFEYFIKSNDFLKITWNTLSLNFLFIVFGLISAVLLAVILYELRSRALTKIYETVLITPHFLSWVVAGYMAYALLNPEYGIVNGFLKSAGLSGISFYTKPEMWPAILTVVSVWKRLGMDCVIYYAALMGVDSSLFEAAEIDGASKIQRTWYILLPSLIPIITIMSILKVGSIFRADFGLFYQLTRNVGALYSTTDVIDTYVFRTMRVVGNMSLSSAVGFMQSIVGFALVVTTNYLSKKIDADSGLF